MTRLLTALFLICGLAAGVLVFTVVRHGFSTREPPSSIESKIARTLRGLAATDSERDARSQTPMSPLLLTEARAHWADHCAGCHANDGSGQTALGSHLYPRAPDMRRSETQKLSDGELYAVIKNGVRLTGMPAWGEPGSADPESWALVAFIRRLPTLSPEELKAMEKLNPRTAQERAEQQEEDEFLNSPPDGEHR